MPEPTRVSLRDPSGVSIGAILISALPRTEPPLDRAEDTTLLRSEPAVQLQEASSYRYCIDVPGTVRVQLQPTELFDADDTSGMTGRIHTRQYVGDVVLTVVNPDRGERGSAPVVVRASKLKHEVEYQRMLREIADLAAEAVLQGFAPATTATAIAPSRPPRILYQQFAILQARLADEELQNAIARVTHAPQRDWVRETEWRSPGRPLKADGEVRRALTLPGQRVRVARPIAELTTLPREIRSYRSEETVDTDANRFVKFALLRWRDLAARIGGILASRSEAAYAMRGMTSVDRVVETLDDVLAARIFTEVGRLTKLPVSNQVLLRREGYRQIFATFALIESSLDLRLELEDAIRPSQRNISSLYEYWTFLKLVGELGEACGDAHAALRLFEQTGDGLSLGLKRGRQSKLGWQVAVAGRQLAISVYFNRTFRATDNRNNDGSWSRAMVPDASVLVRPLQGITRVESARDLDVWLHFDAKYKLDWSNAQFERIRPELEEEAALQEKEEEDQGSSRREDLLKMHAYRDAIRRSAGAYVLFPGGSEPLEFREYLEVIPGLGAFPLRPGDERGVATLRRFLGDVLLHAADQATAEERGRFWRSRIAQQPVGSAHKRTVDFLDRPPSDTPVLVGHVLDQRVWSWISLTHQYVLTLGRSVRGVSIHAEELAAPIILLVGGSETVAFGRRGAWTLAEESELSVLGYPESSDVPAVICQLLWIEQQPPWLAELPLVDLLAGARTPGEPVLTDWATLITASEHGLGGTRTPLGRERRTNQSGRADQRTSHTERAGRSELPPS